MLSIIILSIEFLSKYLIKLKYKIKRNTNLPKIVKLIILVLIFKTNFILQLISLPLIIVDHILYLSKKFLILKIVVCIVLCTLVKYTNLDFIFVCIFLKSIGWFIILLYIIFKLWYSQYFL